MDHGHHSKIYNPYGGVSIETGGVGSDRLLQWTSQETQDLLMIRAELDPAFMDTKRNKLLWEVVSTRMKEMGYTRSPDQCKCKWKNLVTRYKGCETMDITERMSQQFPYYNEMQTIFTARMQRMLWLEAQERGRAAASSSKTKAAAQFSSDEEDENAGEIEKLSSKKKRKLKGTAQSATGGASGKNNNNNNSNIVNGLRDIMDDFMRQQLEIEMQWMKAYEEGEARRREKEMEWRQRMEALGNERIMMERRWREKEQERRISEEARAEKREALITALLNKLRREGV